MISVFSCTSEMFKFGFSLIEKSAKRTSSSLKFCNLAYCSSHFFKRDVPETQFVAVTNNNNLLVVNKGTSSTKVSFVQSSCFVVGRREIFSSNISHSCACNFYSVKWRAPVKTIFLPVEWQQRGKKSFGNLQTHLKLERRGKKKEGMCSRWTHRLRIRSTYTNWHALN